MNMSLELKILSNGYSFMENGEYKANCTCTLIKCCKNVIIDTMTAWDGDYLKAKLKENNLNPEDVELVICTHGHSDHIGCNYLFLNATHIVGYSISRKDHYFDHEFKQEPEYKICDHIKILATPGHTLQDISVLVQQNGSTIAITGDLFEKEEDLADESVWKSAGSDSEQLQQTNRDLILKLADYIVPGHGPMFKNKSKS